MNKSFTINYSKLPAGPSQTGLGPQARHCAAPGEARAQNAEGHRRADQGEAQGGGPRQRRDGRRVEGEGDGERRRGELGVGEAYMRTLWR